MVDLLGLARPLLQGTAGRDALRRLARPL